MAIAGTPTDPRISARVGQLVAALPGCLTGAALRSTAGTQRMLRSTVTAPTTATLYAIRGRVSGGEWQTVSFTTASTSAADLRDGLVAAWNANPVLAGLATASAAASGTAIDITQLTTGPDNPIQAEVVTDPTSDLTAFSVITAGADSYTALFGRYNAITGYSKQGDAQRPVIAEFTEATGVVITYTIGTDASGDYDSVLTVDGVDVTIDFLGGASAGDTDDNAEAAIEAALPAASTGVLVANPSAGTVTLTFPIGVKASVKSSAVSGGSATLAVAVTSASAAIPECALVYDDGSAESLTIGSEPTGYSGRQSAAVVYSAFRAAVEDPDAAITAYGPVYIETADGANKGRPYTAPASTRFAHPSHTWRIADTADRAILGG